MKRRSIMLLSGLVAVALIIPTAAVAKAAKVDVCHLNHLGEWQVNNVKAGAAAQAHLDHGDDLPGEPVPGMAGFTFDDDCVPVADIVVGVDIEKSTNGDQADGANDPDVPILTPGQQVLWTYNVTNTGTASIPGADIVVTDDQIGVLAGPQSGDNDDNGLLDPGEAWLYEAAGTAADLSATSFTTVPGCGDGRPAYENVGTVTVPGDSDSDTSHYCNPAETIFAVAYTDVTDDGGSYDPAHDALIAKLIDFNNSGIPDAGDKIVLAQYPTDLAGTAFANWEVTEHTLESVTVSPSGCTGSITNASFEATFQFYDLSGVEWYYETGTSIYSYIADDDLSGADVLYVFIGSPSQPGADLQLSDSATWQGDDTFVDIDLSSACASA